MKRVTCVVEVETAIIILCQWRSSLPFLIRFCDNTGNNLKTASKFKLQCDFLDSFLCKNVTNWCAYADHAVSSESCWYLELVSYATFMCIFIFFYRVDFFF